MSVLKCLTFSMATTYSYIQNSNYSSSHEAHVSDCQRLSALVGENYDVIIKVMTFFESEKVNRNDEHVIK